MSCMYGGTLDETDEGEMMVVSLFCAARFSDFAPRDAPKPLYSTNTRSPFFLAQVWTARYLNTHIFSP